jgi:inorganic pyrophosphatase
MNLWHAVDISKETVGIVEMPRGTMLKYELHKTTGALILDRVIKTAVPANYGFLPQTLSDDGDPLDVFIYSSFAIEPLAVVKLKVERVIHAFDNGVGDAKIIATVIGDDLDWTAVEKRVAITIDYLHTYKTGMKVVSVLNHKVANEVIEIAKNNYKQKFSKGIQWI